MISRNLKKLAADSNVILSAIIGKAALRVFLHRHIEIITTQFNIQEVQRYLSHFAVKYQMNIVTLEVSLRMLPLSIKKENYYKSKMTVAKKYLDHREPDDVHLSALALHDQTPVWSNDKDYEGLPLTVYSTKALLDTFEL